MGARGRPKGSKNKAKGEQTKLKVDDRSAIHKPVRIEVARKMSPEAFDTAASESARAHNKIKALEKEIRDFARAPRPGEGPDGEDLPSRKDEIKALVEKTTKLDREIEAESHLVDTDCIEVHDVNRNTVTVYVSEAGALGEKIKERAMTPDERRQAEEAAPFAPPIEAPGDDAERTTEDPAGASA